MLDYSSALAAEFGLKNWQTENLISLIDEGNTIPFIARYRKEQHGTLDDQLIRQIADRLQYMRNLDARRDEIKTLIESQGKLTEEIITSIDKAVTLSEIEDIYRPFRPKRKTRASVAKEKGLMPLALEILEQKRNGKYPIDYAEAYVNDELDVKTAEEALKGAMDIIAEMISDEADIRKRIRNIALNYSTINVKAAKDEDSVYRNYYDFSQPIKKLANHRILAIDRGEKEGFLKVNVRIDDERGRAICSEKFISGNSPSYEFISAAAEDAYSRLIYPSIEREVRNELTSRAAADAIKVFSENLRNLLMQPPVKGKTTIGLDPGYRTGCKVAVVDPTGKVLDTGVAYITHGTKGEEESARTILSFIKKYNVTLIAIGNGTASKETEIFTYKLIKENNLKVDYMVVSEAGASVYSASKLAAEEYPEYDLTLRSAVSIAHRLQDPLAELVKIDPKAIGVGQYQHDMPQKELSAALSGVVESCVNSVGVDLNTASISLLTNVAGISNAVAKNIVAYRQENGLFSSRSELKKVSKLGPKAYEQCAGFLRVPESANILDNTAVHPEAYSAAKMILETCGYNLKKIPKTGFSELSEKVNAYGKNRLAESAGIGIPTLDDIVAELIKPGRDPRDEIEKVMLRSDIKDIKDLKSGMEINGTVRNVTDFGAFVDIGVHQDGLVHITQISNKFIRHPSDVLKVGDIIKTWVLSVDISKGRIALTMKEPKN